MPIKQENRGRYPSDWKRIVSDIRQRSGNRCEGSPAYPDCRAENGEPHPVTGSKVVLTVAHLDHTPENCAADNLRHMCQRCHLTYDAKHHAANAAETRRRKLASGDLFDVPSRHQPQINQPSAPRAAPIGIADERSLVLADHIAKRAGLMTRRH